MRLVLPTVLIVSNILPVQRISRCNRRPRGPARRTGTNVPRHLSSLHCRCPDRDFRYHLHFHGNHLFFFADLANADHVTAPSRTGTRICLSRIRVCIVRISCGCRSCRDVLWFCSTSSVFTLEILFSDCSNCRKKSSQSVHHSLRADSSISDPHS